MKDNIQIREINENEIEEVVGFHNAFYNDNRTAEQWKWEYKGIYPDLYVFKVVKRDNHLIGTQGMIPIYLNISGKRYLTGKSENSLIHPKYQGVLFLKIYKEAMSLCKAKDMNCVWGYTSQVQVWRDGLKFKVNEGALYESVYVSDALQSLPEIFAKNWKIIFKITLAGFISVLSLYTNIFRLLNLFKKHSINKKYLIEKKLRSIKDLDILYEKIRVRYPNIIHLDQDEKFINWRIYNNPILKYETIFLYEDDTLKGYCYFNKNNKNTAFLSDFTFENDEAGVFLLMAFLTYCRKQNVGLIYFFGNLENILMAKVFNLFKRFGFLKRKSRVALVIKNILFKKEEDLNNVENWYANGFWSEGYQM